MMRSRWIASTLLVALLGFVSVAAEVELHYFWAATCPDCLVMKEFLAELSAEYPTLKVVDYDVRADPGNLRLMLTLARAYGLTQERTPTVFVGGVAVAGIGRAVELRIQEEVERCLAEGCASPLDRPSAKSGSATSRVEIVVLLVAVGLALLLLLLGE
ncbi:TPA: hypothetical protein DCY65_04165 [Candidatus Acetothermia bacterium]|nr:hypothetical protein [Candidatus Acetothermia bacterium]